MVVVMGIKLHGKILKPAYWMLAILFLLSWLSTRFSRDNTFFQSSLINWLGCQKNKKS